MAVVLQPAGLWMQLASATFLASALFWDLLIIRILLVIAYIWLLVAASTGFPNWPALDNPGKIGVDGIVWACLNLFFHGLATAMLLWDERRIKFKDPEVQALWLYFYRRGGMGKTEFLETYKRCQLRRFRAGQTILRPRQARHKLALLIEGLASYRIEMLGGRSASRRSASGRGQLGEAATSTGQMVSGLCFDMSLLNVFGIYVSFLKEEDHTCIVTADTGCLVALWELEDLDYLATQAGPAVSSSWRNFTLCQLGIEYPFKQQGHLMNSRHRLEPPGVLQGTARSSDFTDPLDELEAPPRLTLKSFLLWLPSKFGPFVPPGIRHLGLPVTGAMARQRVMAVLHAAGREDVSEGELLRLMATPAKSFWERLGLGSSGGSSVTIAAPAGDSSAGSASRKGGELGGCGGEEMC